MFNPDTKASLGVVARFNGIFAGAAGEGYIYSDGNSNNLRFRSGSSAGYKYAGLNDDGTLQIFNGGLQSAGDVRSAGALYAAGRVVVGEGQANSYIEMRDTDEGTRYIDNNGGTIGFLGSDGNWKMGVDDAVGVGTAELGEISSGIEERRGKRSD